MLASSISCKLAGWRSGWKDSLPAILLAGHQTGNHAVMLSCPHASRLACHHSGQQECKLSCQTACLLAGCLAGLHRAIFPKLRLGETSEDQMDAASQRLVSELTRTGMGRSAKAGPADAVL
jgi:hypothetical protein